MMNIIEEINEEFFFVDCERQWEVVMGYTNKSKEKQKNIKNENHINILL